jgi:hypothetical protein
VHCRGPTGVIIELGGNFVSFASHFKKVTPKRPTGAEVTAESKCFTTLTYVVQILNFKYKKAQIQCSYFFDNVNNLRTFQQAYLTTQSAKWLLDYLMYWIVSKSIMLKSGM